MFPQCAYRCFGSTDVSLAISWLDRETTTPTVSSLVQALTPPLKRLEANGFTDARMDSSGLLLHRRSTTTVYAALCRRALPARHIHAWPRISLLADD